MIGINLFVDGATKVQTGENLGPNGKAVQLMGKNTKTMGSNTTDF